MASGSRKVVAVEGRLGKLYEEGVSRGHFCAPCTLACQRLHYRVGDDLVLRDVSMVVQPGDMVAVLGGAENGTEEFLRILADQQDKGDVSGQVTLDGALRTPSFHRPVGERCVSAALAARGGR